MTSRRHACLAICVLASVVLGWTGASFVRRGEQAYSPAPAFPIDKAENLSIDELAQRFGNQGRLILPTWMPREVMLRQVYLYHSMAVLVYSSEDVKDYREGDVIVQITLSPYNQTPSELLQRATSDPRGPAQLFDLGAVKVLLWENASPDEYMMQHGYEPIVAVFHYDHIFYGVTGIKGRVSTDEIVSIIRSMPPVGSETLRKA